LFVGSCSSDFRKISRGSIVYQVDYPEQKNNAFLYNILPKETEISFQDGVIKNDISQANLFNFMLIDCNNKYLDLYHQYGDDGYNVKMNENEINSMIHNLPKYSIKFISESRDIAGLKAQKAIATSKDNPNDKIELWYTEEIEIPNPNWYNPYRDVPGVLLVYSVTQFGIKMNYKAISFSKTKAGAINEQLSIPTKGSLIDYNEYTAKMSQLFQSFQ
jgi:GLPGLI family protein